MNPGATAIKRKNLSRPMRDLYLTPRMSLLDYGCGRGDDVRLLREKGVKAEGYDPNQAEWSERPPQGPYDRVTMIYVLNTIDDHEGRLRAIQSAWWYVKPGTGRLVVATRTFNEVQQQAAKAGWSKQGDGWVTSRDTFQTGFSSQALMTVVRTAIGEHGSSYSHSPYVAVEVWRP